MRKFFLILFALTYSLQAQTTAFDTVETKGFYLTTGASTGYVMKSQDASGKGYWANLESSSGASSAVLRSGQENCAATATPIAFSSALPSASYTLFIRCYSDAGTEVGFDYSSLTTTGFTVTPISPAYVEYIAVIESTAVYAGIRTGSASVSDTTVVEFSSNFTDSDYFLFLAFYSSTSPYTQVPFDYANKADSGFTVYPSASGTLKYLAVDYESSLADIAREGTDSVFTAGTTLTFSTPLTDDDFSILVRVYSSTNPYTEVPFTYSGVTSAGFTVTPTQDALCDYLVVRWTGTESGIFSLNALTNPTQVFAIDSTGSTWTVVSSGGTHTLTYPGSRLAYNDKQNTFKIAQVFGSATNGVIIDSSNAVRLNGSATVWDDLMFPSTQVRQGATTKPDFDIDTLALMFPQNDSTEIAYIVVQMPHRWKEGTTVYPHVHWLQSQDDTADFAMQYKWFNIEEAFPTTWQWYRMNLPEASYEPGTKMQQLNEGSGGISGSGKSISSIILIRLKRLYGDGYPNDAAMLQFDIHYEIDSFGSNTELSKD